MGTWRRRQMMAAAVPLVQEEYIVFADPVVAQICATNWGDGIGITPSQAARVTDNQFGTTFRNNSSITSFDEMRYFTGVTSLAGNAFRGCSNLASISFPDGLTSIGNMAFYSCSHLVEMTFGAVAASCTVGSDAFSQKATRVNFPTLQDFSNFIKNINNVNEGILATGGDYYIGNDILTSYIIPNTHTKICSGAFRNATHLASVTIHANVTEIQNLAFRDCVNLTSVSVPSGVTTIGTWAFANVPAVMSLNLPSLATLGVSAFRGSGVTDVSFGAIASLPASVFYQAPSLVSIELPSTVTSIGADCFGVSTNNTVKILATTPPSLGATPFGNKATIYVPYSADHSVLAAYQSAWTSYASKIYELNPDGTIPS